MTIIRAADRKLRACLSAKELLTLIISKFFTSLSKKINSGSYSDSDISANIKEFANKSVDSIDYEFFTSILILYEQFDKDCNFCFNLTSLFNPEINKIQTLEDLILYREDPPDVLVQYKNNYYEFELKRYRGDLTSKSLWEFVRKKIITHYSDKQNYLIILQPKAYSEISNSVFKELHVNIKKLKKYPGVICFTLNNDNKEMILIRVFPKLEKLKPQRINEKDIFAEILHSE